MTASEKGHIGFPCPWEMRVIAFGDRAASVRQELASLLDGDGQPSCVADGASSAGGKYVAFRLTFTARDRDHLERLGHAVASIPGVKMLI